MSNLKKISAVAVAGAMMLTTYVPAFAAYSPVNGSKATVLNGLDLYAGTSTSTFEPALEASLTRGQGAVLLAKLFNMDTAAQALTDAEANAILKGFADASKVPTYAKKRLAYLVKNNIMSGSKDTSTGKLYIDADKELIGGQFATLILKQLGYTVSSWKLAIDQLAEVNGAADIATYASFGTSSILRDQAVGLIYGALTADYATGTDNVIEKIIAANPALASKAEAAGLVASATLAVESVTALNLREIQVKFNKAVVADEAKKVTNYTLKYGSSSSTYNPEAVTLSSDSKVATIRVSDANKMSNYASDVQLTIAKAVGLGADSVISGINVKDVTPPSVASVQTTGPRNIKVTLSEPIKESTLAAAAFKVDNGLIGIESATVSGLEVSIKTYSDLSEGAHKIEVVTPSNVTDSANYPLQGGSYAFNYTKDTSALSFSVVESTETSVTIMFNKAIKTGTLAGNSNIKVTHTYNTSTNEVTGAAITTTDDQKFVIDFGSSKPFPPAATTVYINYVSDSGTKVEDNYGNKLAATTFTVTTTADLTKPTAAAEFVDANTIKVTYSEDVLGTTTNAATNKDNYTLKSGTDTIAISSVAFDGDSKKVVKLTTATMNGGTYTLTVKNVKDVSVAANKIDDATLTFTGTDKVAPTVKSVTLVSAKKLKVVFSEAMDVASIVDKNNYKLQYNNTTTAAIGDKDTIEAVDANKAVVITLDKDLQAGGSYDLQIGRVKDLAGNWIDAYVTEKSFTGANVASVDIKEFQITGKNSIKLVFDDTVQNPTYNDFMYSTDSGLTFAAAKGISEVSVVDGKTYITIITNDLPDTVGSTLAVKTSAGTISSQNVYGSQVAFNTTSSGISAIDKYAPVYTTVSSITTGSAVGTANTTGMAIELDYSENIYAASVQESDYTVDGYTISEVIVAGDKVTIIVNVDDSSKLPASGSSIKVKQVGEIQDTAKNISGAQDAWTVTMP